MKGHCMCYSQNIEELCKEIPNKKEEVIGKVIKHDTRDFSSHIDAFKVKRSKVLKALRWLKLHNIHYHDIIINESNFEKASQSDESKRAIIAGWVNGIRLIDNMPMNGGAQ